MELKELMKKAGIIGAGGAGFPSYAKLAEGARTLLINGSECEPLIYTDLVLLKRELDTVLDGATAVIKESGIRECYLCIKRHTAKRLSFNEGDMLTPDVRVKLLPDSYPIGDEISLIYEAVGEVVKPGHLPISRGIIVYNVETLYNLGRAVKLGESVCTKWLTVGGDIESPAVIKVPVGTPVSHIFASLGIKVKESQAVLDGGPSMGKIINHELYTVKKNTKAILILPKDTPAITGKLMNEKLAASRAETACCQCTRCTDMCPRHLLGYPLEPHKMVRTAMQPVKAMPMMVLSATLCCGCGICESIACSQGISPRAVIGGYKAILAEGKLKYIAKGEVSPRQERDYRIIPSEKWASTLGVKRFDREAEYIEKIPTPDRVEIHLNSHIGGASIPTVKDGDLVHKGDEIARAAEGLSVSQHATIDGRITLCRDKIRIDKG